ncbi:MAG TPA: hypothetical protein VKF40_06260 [Burkholderiales bacterium]|nr:hypothetical protein [Burkholderiales bacterium]
MRKLHSFLFCLALAATVQAQIPSEVARPASEKQTAQKTIEGYWQDTARRILFTRDAPASYAYGQWTALDQSQTYPSAKQIRKSAKGFELVDLLYDDTYAIRIVRADDRSIEFVRSAPFPACEMRHTCSLQGEEMLCSLENVCREGGKDVLDWKGEERYARRENCERGLRREAQGIPHRCR